MTPEPALCGLTRLCYTLPMPTPAITITVSAEYAPDLSGGKRALVRVQVLQTLRMPSPVRLLAFSGHDYRGRAARFASDLSHESTDLADSIMRLERARGSHCVAPDGNLFALCSDLAFSHQLAAVDRADPRYQGE